jgi:hypothetical protein
MAFDLDQVRGDWSSMPGHSGTEMASAQWRHPLALSAIRSSHQPQRSWVVATDRRSPMPEPELPFRTGTGARTSTTVLNIGPLSVAARWKCLCLRDNAKLFGLPHRAGCTRRPKRGRALLGKADKSALQRVGTPRRSRKIGLLVDGSAGHLRLDVGRASDVATLEMPLPVSACAESLPSHDGG